MTDENELQKSYQRLLDGNRRWVQECLDDDPSYFTEMAKGQSPAYLWIGCADSRVPANVITGTAPGEVFVHRNIANVVAHTDSNMLSVLQYAVEYLEVQHVIVCGHYGCGGVDAAMSNKDYGFINNWLMHIKDVYRLHTDELEELRSREALLRRMTELNVLEGVTNLAKTTIIQEAWQKRQAPQIHGWVYDLGEGLIRDLGLDFRSADALDDHYRYTKFVEGQR